MSSDQSHIGHQFCEYLKMWDFCHAISGGALNVSWHV
jgi:hypothetical protein